MEDTVCHVGNSHASPVEL